MSFSGEIVFMRVYDLGGTLNMPKAREILGPMAETAAVQPMRAAPEYVSFAAPILLNLSKLNLDLRTDTGQPLGLSARLYEVGALALMLRVPVKGEALSELGRYQMMDFRTRGAVVKRL